MSKNEKQKMEATPPPAQVKQVRKRPFPERLVILEGSPLRKWRAEKNLSLDEAGVMAEASREAFRSWEMGEGMPRDKSLLALARAMQLSVEEVYNLLNDWHMIRKSKVVAE